jgi:hypothetical protein
MKFSSNGTHVWSLGINGLALQNNGLYGWYKDGIKATDVCVDGEDNIYVIAHTHIQSVDRVHINIFKFNSSGTTQWHRIVEIETTSSTLLEPMGNICVDSTGLYVLMPRYASGDDLYGMTVARMNKEDGEPVWQKGLGFPTFSLYGTTLGGIRPYGIEVRKKCLHIIGDINSEKLMVTMKLPATGFPAGKFRNMKISSSSLTFYSDIADVPYLEEADGSGHYVMNTTTSVALDITSGSFTNNTVTSGDSETDNWRRTDKILKKQIKRLVR